MDALSLSMLFVALLEGSRALGNFAAFIRIGRVMRLARCGGWEGQLKFRDGTCLYQIGCEMM